MCMSKCRVMSNEFRIEYKRFVWASFQVPQNENQSGRWWRRWYINLRSEDFDLLSTGSQCTRCTQSNYLYYQCFNGGNVNLNFIVQTKQWIFCGCLHIECFNKNDYWDTRVADICSDRNWSYSWQFKLSDCLFSSIKGDSRRLLYKLWSDGVCCESNLCCSSCARCY